MANNILKNGTVLPSGLLNLTRNPQLAGFKKTYQNTALRMGVIIESYEITSQNNISKLVPEYDVMVFEQNENNGATTIIYKNCMAAASLGSIADFFEAHLRKLEEKTTKGITPNPGGQNGALVLVLCLDGNSDKGVIIGAINHPDRSTTLTDAGPHLEGEYNGVNIKVEKDGSTSLTFKGATDNDGKVTDSTQGNTVLSIEKDGSYQVSHSTITQRLDRNGKASITAKDDITNTSKKNINLVASENIVVTANKDFSLTSNNLIAKAQGSATLECQKLSVTSQSEINLKGSQLQVEAESLANIKAPQITLNGFVALGGDGGQPVLLMTTQLLGVGNLGMPVLSTAISGYALKVTGQ